MEGFKVPKRDISFSNVQIPKFPEAPSANITVEDMAELIRRVCSELGVTL
jgi:hypothetical protein